MLVMLVHPLNILDISVTFEVLNPLRSMLANLEQPLNKLFKLVTVAGMKLFQYIVCSFLQSSNIW